MSKLVFVSYAWPRKDDHSAIRARDRFMTDFRVELGRNTARSDENFCFYDFKDIAAGTHDYNERLRASLDNCAVALILRDKAYLDPEKPYCLWEYQQLSKRSSAANEMLDGPKVLLVVNWNTVQRNDIPHEWRPELQCINQSIIDGTDQEVVGALKRVEDEGLLNIIALALAGDSNAAIAYLRFVQTLVKYVVKQRAILEKALLDGAFKFSSIDPYVLGATWTISHAAVAPSAGSTPDRKRIIYSVVAAGLEEITKVSASRAWRYKDDGFEDWRPFAESEDKPSARVLDIISQFTTGKRQIGEMKSLTFTEHVVDDLKKFYGKYPIVFFVDPWTIHKIDSFRVALRRVANLSSGEVGHATAIIVWNDFDADIRAERHEIDRKLSSTFEGTVLLPTPASASAETSVTGVLEREVEELRRQIRKHATPRIERTGTKKPMVIASESLC